MSNEHNDLIDLKDVILPRFAMTIFRDVIAPVRHPVNELNPLAPSEHWCDYNKGLHYEGHWKDGQVIHSFQPYWKSGQVCRDAIIKISNVRVVGADKIEIGTVDAVDQPKNGTENRVLDEILNDNETPIPSTINFEKLVEAEEQKSKETEWGVAASLEVKRAMEAKAGVEGIAEATSSIEITAKVESHVNQKMGKTNRRLEALRQGQERTYTAAPFTKLEVVQETSVKNVRMDVLVHGRLECTINVWACMSGNSRRAGNQQYNMTWDSINELERILRGELADKHEWFSNHYAQPKNRWGSNKIANKLNRPVLTVNVPVEGQNVLSSKIVSHRTILPGHPEYGRGSTKSRVGFDKTRIPVPPEYGNRNGKA